MNADVLISAIWAVGLVILIAVVLVSRRARRHGGSYRAGVAGALWELQTTDRRRALEMIVEEKAEERRPEYPDGNLPDLGRRRMDQRDADD